MNSFSNMEINDLLDNRFRLEDKHTPNYLAECFQRLFPTLGRMGLSTVIDEWQGLTTEPLIVVAYLFGGKP